MVYVDRRTVILGASGFGKSTVLQTLADSTTPERRAVLLDLQESMRAPATTDGVLLRPTDDDWEPGDGPYCEWVGARAREALEIGRIHFLVDELDLACESREKAHHDLQYLALRGRKHEISWTWNTQDYSNVPRSLTSQVTDVIIFHTTEPAHLEYARKRGCSQETLRVIRSMPVGTSIHIGVDGRPHLHRGAATYAFPCVIEPET